MSCENNMKKEHSTVITSEDVYKNILAVDQNGNGLNNEYGCLILSHCALALL